jgi:hypothetical protein
MRATIWLMGTLLAVLSPVASLGCGGEAPITCDENGCECRNRDSCTLDCGDLVGCEPTCSNFVNFCAASCTSECVFGCRGGGEADCGVVCGDNCTADCRGTPNCSVDTGSTSVFACLTSENCSAELGDDSTAECANVGTCSIRCEGLCTVACILETTTCNVECMQHERVNCGQGIFVCGRECP